MKNETNSNYFTNKPGQTGQRTNKLRHELILGCSGDKGFVYHHAQYNDIAGMNIFNKKESIPMIYAVIQFILTLRY